jgi:hypothetical protein
MKATGNREEEGNREHFDKLSASQATGNREEEGNRQQCFYSELLNF